MIDLRSVFLGACKPCGGVWPLVILPAPMEHVAKLISRSCCPNCGSTGEAHFIPTEEQAAAWAQRQEARGA